MCKCVECKFCKVEERDIYDADQVRHHEVRYVCGKTGKARDILCNRACPSFKRAVWTASKIERTDG